jgi:hypothetical protein
VRVLHRCHLGRALGADLLREVLQQARQGGFHLERLRDCQWDARRPGQAEAFQLLQWNAWASLDMRSQLACGGRPPARGAASRGVQCAPSSKRCLPWGEGSPTLALLLERAPQCKVRLLASITRRVYSAQSLEPVSVPPSYRPFRPAAAPGSGGGRGFFSPRGSRRRPFGNPSAGATGGVGARMLSVTV